MTENILGILFVTSSSRGRNVFRYPPDPLSPSARLSQPIYPGNTYTATDTVAGHAIRKTLFPESYGHYEPRGKSSSASLRGSAGAGAAAGAGAGGGAGVGGGGGAGRIGRGWADASSDGEGSGRLARLTDDGDGTGVGAVGMGMGMEGDSDDDEDSDESEYEYIWMAGANPSGVKSSANEAAAAMVKEDGIGVGVGGKKDGQKPVGVNGGITIEVGSRRSSIPDELKGGGCTAPRRDSGGGTVTGHPSTSTREKGLTRLRDRDRNREQFIERQYSHALSYSLDFLSDMLSPPRSASNRKFEICVDELVFVGHPVCIGADGKWGLPEDDGDERESRGRRGRMPNANANSNANGNSNGNGNGNANWPASSSAAGRGGQDSHLRTVVEAGEASNNTSPRDSLVGSGHDLALVPNGQHTQGRGDASSGHDGANSKDAEDGPPILNMFHLVLILDKPDPKLGAPTEGPGAGATSVFEDVYREIAFKWTAAAWALQVRDNFVGRESWEMAKMRDKCVADGVPIIQCCKIIYRSSALDRSLTNLFYALHEHQNAPVNPLYAHLPTTITVPLADMAVTMILSPKLGDSDESWAHWGGMDDDVSDNSSESSEDWVHEMLDQLGGGNRDSDLRVEPWQTLLLLEEGAADKAGEMANALVGLGLGQMGIGGPQGILAADSGTATGTEESRTATASPVVDLLNSRRGSKDTTAEEDEKALMQALIEACDVSKPLAEIAHVLRFDLDGILIPLARELVQNKQAVLIDVVTYRLRTIVMPTTIAEHSTSLERRTAEFARAFPSFPPLPGFLSQISSAPKPFRDVMPTDTGSDVHSRQPYFDALLWLLRKDLVVQVHTRARIFARPEVKESAWIRLWHRRRERWLVERAKASRPESPTDLITPRASEGVNPMDVLTPTATTHRDDGPDQGYMDYDPNLEMDSDLGEGDAGESVEQETMSFSVDAPEPTKDDIPAFKGSFIFKPSRATKDEARWLKVIREGHDEVWASKFDLCVQYFDGAVTFEEISYRTGLPKRELDYMTKEWKDDVITLMHP